MCGRRDDPEPDDRMLELQKEQMAEQKRQYEEQKASQEERYAEQKAIAEAPPAPPPSPVAQSAAAALEITAGGTKGSALASRRRGYGRKKLRTDLQAGSGLNIP
tara:strand:+ start:151 stop:462 length:312 start_codon:yes stop_codon:yes gene_type:complete